jgi:hypothetical protein
MSTPRTSAAVWYIHRSPGWYIRGNVPSRRILRAGRSHSRKLRFNGTLDGVGTRHLEDEAETKAKRQQVAKRDRSICGLRFFDRAIESFQDLSVSEFRQKRVYRVIESEAALFDEDHRRHRDDRFRHRGYPENRVALHLRTVQGSCSDRFNVDLIVSAEEGYDAGQFPSLYVAVHHAAESVQPRFGQSASHHY